MGDVKRATALYGQVTAGSVAGLPELRRAVTDPDALVRHVAAVQLAFHRPTELPESAVRELLGTLVALSRRVPDKSSLAADYTVVTDDGEDCWELSQHITMALARLPAGSADFAVPELVALWQRDRQFYEAVLAAIALSFPEGGRPVASTLSNSQRTVLAALTDDEAIWTFCGDTAPMLLARRLPTSRGALRSFLASASGSE
jgi:hypothetical protein